MIDLLQEIKNRVEQNNKLWQGIGQNIEKAVGITPTYNPASAIRLPVSKTAQKRYESAKGALPKAVQKSQTKPIFVAKVGEGLGQPAVPYKNKEQEIKATGVLNRTPSIKEPSLFESMFAPAGGQTLESVRGELATKPTLKGKALTIGLAGLAAIPLTPGKVGAKAGVVATKKLLPKVPKIVKSAQRSLEPLKAVSKEAQTAFKTWSRERLVARETANEVIPKLKNVPNDANLAVPHPQVAETLKGLREKAIKAGFDVSLKENYLPQAYSNKPEEIKVAVTQFLKDKSVAPDVIENYINRGQDMPKVIAERLKINPSFTKHAVFPDYETAIKYGIKPLYTNQAQLVAKYAEELDRTLANRKFIDKLTQSGDLVKSHKAPVGYEPVTLAFAPKGLSAPPELAKMLNGMFRDENALGFGEQIIKGIATASRKMQEIKLSAGIPKTTGNFFAFGQAIKSLTTALGHVATLDFPGASNELKSTYAFIRANSNSLSAKWFEKNQPYIKMMADNGIDLGNRIGQYQDVYKNLSADKGFKLVLGKRWNSWFNEKTFASFMPQMYTQTFKDVYKSGLKKGLTDTEAQKLATETTQKFFGLFENAGRSKGAEDLLSAVFFAPKFREGIIRTLWNTGRSITTDIRNPAFQKNRRLALGMAITYASYNALNKQLNGNYMWENEPGKEFDLKIPLPDGQYTYLGFMPSFLAFARNIGSGILATGQGDIKTAKQKFGSVFSMPLKVMAEVSANKDYFGRTIYNENDNGKTKAEKIAKYIGLDVSHPFITETMKQLFPEFTLGKGKTAPPIYQSISQALELPFKFNTVDQVAKSQFYKAMDEHKKVQYQATQDFKPKYDHIVELTQKGLTDQAQGALDDLSDQEYEIYKSILASDKRYQTQKGEADIYDTVIQVRQLMKEGKNDEAQKIVDGLSDEEYRLFNLAANKTK